MSKETKIRVARKPFIGKGGKKYGSRVLYADGSVKTFLNPHGKGVKYAAELKNNERYTNEGERKKTASGGTLHLTGKGRAYRAGYLQAQHDSAETYKAKRSGGFFLLGNGGKKK